jgi:hypothetical protein
VAALPPLLTVLRPSPGPAGDDWFAEATEIA